MVYTWNGVYIVSQPANKRVRFKTNISIFFQEKQVSLHIASPVFVLSVKVMLSVKVTLKFSPLQTGLHGDELLLKLRWWKPGVASRADSVVKMVGRKKTAIREVRRTMVLTRVERLSRPRL